ncbi:multiubiquitin domain-containing protein [Domibacillus epiphyticus]|uniref:multiubiquitin domain-containing protein n=1 Tax=Domibacillus epiphyticus TaxID=1714355 RepID=UPI001E4FF0C2|nr:multiubiquitin domain-containing protein [Domibacillus epiphyticus]
MTKNKDLNLTVVNIEEHSKEGKPVPKHNVNYKFRVDKIMVVSETRFLTGRNILIKAGLVPPDNYRLDMKLKGGSTRKIELDEEVDFATPGLERFLTLPLDQTEGTCNGTIA